MYSHHHPSTNNHEQSKTCLTQIINQIKSINQDTKLYPSGELPKEKAEQKILKNTTEFNYHSETEEYDGKGCASTAPLTSQMHHTRMVLYFIVLMMSTSPGVQKHCKAVLQEQNKDIFSLTYIIAIITSITILKIRPQRNNHNIHRNTYINTNGLQSRPMFKSHLERLLKNFARGK